MLTKTLYSAPLNANADSTPSPESAHSEYKMRNRLQGIKTHAQPRRKRCEPELFSATYSLPRQSPAHAGFSARPAAGEDTTYALACLA